MDDKLLKLIEGNARLNSSEIAVMLGSTEAEVAAAIEEYESKGVIRGYNALIDWDKTDREFVTAHIELKVTPQRDSGFDQIAEQILKFVEVKSVYLMSGGFDLAVTVEGRTFKDVALFVAERLAPMDSVISTATHFVLRKYKDNGVIFNDKQSDERRINWL